MSSTIAHVTADYQAIYPDAISVRAGDVVALGRSDAEWPGWVWCTSAAGKSGWVPERYLEPHGVAGTLLCDYDATELSVHTGDVLTVEHTESGWAWAANRSGQRGWVPLSHLRVEPAPADDTQTAAEP